MGNQINNFLIYTAANNEVRVDVLMDNQMLWLSQKAMSLLFGCTTDNVSLHLKNIFESKELEEKSVAEVFSATAADGKIYKVKHYNLDAIFSVGYRISSSKATQFRIWATNTLKEYIIKGFVIDDARLKQGQSVFGKDYFKELLQRVRSIRASERRIYQQVTIFLRSALLIMIKTHPSQKIFMLWCKINFILP